MSAIAISTLQLSKRYRIGERERYLALRDKLTEWAKLPFRAVAGHGLRSTERPFIWAIRDVDLEIRQGQVTGIIGRNGSGKTTLLKILARVTRPTLGRAEIHGRVGSLLEVGTGFHPELTGRENAYLSGAILGMQKREIDSKFDEIVDFSGVEQFIDTPLKRYSTGMQMRLAFAVAAHLEPEILLVDEVLAVGDLEFQRKCLGKMEDVSKGGRTVVFVSHQMNQIRRLCDRVVWLENGGVVQEGETSETVSAYETAMSANTGMAQSSSTNSKARIVGWAIAEANGPDVHAIESHGQCTLKFMVRVERSIKVSEHGISLTDTEGRLIWAWAGRELEMAAGISMLSYRFPMLPLRPGVYSWRLSLYDDAGLVDVWDCVPQMAVATENYQHYADQWNGILNLPFEFNYKEANR